jgi:hypothetical protein
MESIKSNYNNTPTQIYIHRKGEIMSDDMRHRNEFFEINFLQF